MVYKNKIYLVGIEGRSALHICIIIMLRPFIPWTIIIFEANTIFFTDFKGFPEYNFFLSNLKSNLHGD